jgi:hypothetical protein
LFIAGGIVARIAIGNIAARIAIANFVARIAITRSEQILQSFSERKRFSACIVATDFIARVANGFVAW